MGDSNHTIPRSRLNIDSLRFGLATLNRLSAIILYRDSPLFVFLAAEILAIPALRFAIRDSVPLRDRRDNGPKCSERFSDIFRESQ